MEVLIDELEFAQEPHVNSLITWVINGNRYKNVYFFMDMNKKICWSIKKHS